MTSWDGPFPPPARPIRVAGGIRARTARGRIGQQWWSRRFLEVLESFGLHGRLARGRSYARQGQVLALEIDSGAVAATVQGSRTTPYQVRLELTPLTGAEWSTVERALADQAIYCARLLAGEMPHDIEAVFEAAGAPLFPHRRSDVRMSCTCPDQAVPCKHLAAVCYLLAESFDEDPFRILHWRGRAREALLTRLRELRGGADGGALADLTSAPVTEMLDRFWLSPVPLPDGPPPTLPTAADLLLRQLPTPAATLGGDQLIDALRPAYRRAGHAEPSGPDSSEFGPGDA